MSQFTAYSPKMQFFGSDGKPLAGGSVKLFEANTEELATVYGEDGLECENPVLLDSRGECAIRFASGQSYKMRLLDADGAEVWTVDDVNAGETAETIMAKVNVKGDSYIDVTKSVTDGVLVFKLAFDKNYLSDTTAALGDLEERVAANEESIATNTANIETNASAIEANASAIETNTANIATNAAAISELETGKQDAITAGTGLTFSGTTLNHSNSTTARTSWLGNENEVPRLKIDAQGHVTESTTATIYPPTTAGEQGQVWESVGDGSGEWSDRLTEAESAIETNAANITTNASGISTNAAAIAELSEQLTTLANTLSNLTGDDDTVDLASLATQVATNAANIATNAAAIATNATDIATNASAITSLESSKQDALTAGTGLTFSGTTLNHSNSVTAKTSYVGSATAVPRIMYDAQGHITGTSTSTIYPPTTAGTSGQVWVSDGSGAGAWSDRLTTAETDIDTKQDALTAGTGLSLSGTTLNHSNSVTAATSYIGSTTAVPRIKIDAQGHITGYTTATIYPPTSAGTSGQVWVSDGSGAGAWSDRLTTLETTVSSSPHNQVRSIFKSCTSSDYTLILHQSTSTMFTSTYTSICPWNYNVGNWDYMHVNWPVESLGELQDTLLTVYTGQANWSTSSTYYGIFNGNWNGSAKGCPDGYNGVRLIDYGTTDYTYKLWRSMSFGTEVNTFTFTAGGDGFFVGTKKDLSAVISAEEPEEILSYAKKADYNFRQSLFGHYFGSYVHIMLCEY